MIELGQNKTEQWADLERPCPRLRAEQARPHTLHERIAILEALEAQAGCGDRIAQDHPHAAGAKQLIAARSDRAGAINAHRNDGNLSLKREHKSALFERLQCPVETPRALGKQQHRAAFCNR